MVFQDTNKSGINTQIGSLPNLNVSSGKSFSIDQLQVDSVVDLRKSAQESIAKLVLQFAKDSTVQNDPSLKKALKDLSAIHSSLNQDQAKSGTSINLNDKNVLNNIIKRCETFGKTLLLEKIKTEVWGKVASNGLRDWSEYSDLANKCNSTISALSGKQLNPSDAPAFDVSSAESLCSAINQVKDFSTTIKSAEQAKNLYNKNVMLDIKLRALAENNPAISEKLAFVDSIFAPGGSRSNSTPTAETFNKAKEDLQYLMSYSQQQKLTIEEQKSLVTAYKSKLITNTVAQNQDNYDGLMASTEPGPTHGPSAQPQQEYSEVTIPEELKKLLLKRIDQFLTKGGGKISKEEALSMEPTQLMNDYANAVVRCARQINPDLQGSSSECAGPVRRALGAVGVTDGQKAIVNYDRNGNPIRSGSARQYPNYFTSGMFKNNFVEIADVPQKQPELSEFLKQLPKGVIVTYLDSSRPSWHGHIQVSLGDGNYISDFKHDELVYRRVSNVRAFIPVASSKDHHR
jgi:hypothetical protein